MKNIYKFLFIGCLAVMTAVSCDKEGIGANHKVKYADPADGKLLTLTYDDSQRFSSNTANRAKIYDINGIYVKLTTCVNDDFGDEEYDPNDPVKLIAAGYCCSDDMKDDQLVDAGILMLTEATDSVGRLSDIKAMVAEIIVADAAGEESAFSYVAPLCKNAGYLVKAQIAEDVVKYFAFVVPQISTTLVPVEEVVERTPFGNDVFATVNYHNFASTIIWSEVDRNGEFF